MIIALGAGECSVCPLTNAVTPDVQAGHWALCRPYGTRLINFILPGTDVPGYRLCRPCGTTSVAVLNPLAQPERIALRPHNSMRVRDVPCLDIEGPAGVITSRTRYMCGTGW